MTRREALQQSAWIVGGIAFLPAACRQRPERVAAAVDLMNLTPAQRTRLAQVVETIIPSGETPGGADLALHDFVLVMV
ncbi:MAG: gluconate 2-dehydrogenase subunit 3 family protein, partial [Catalinimonas sp.]